MTNVTRARFSDAPWVFKDNKPEFTVGGAGGIGSWLMLFLSRAGNYSRIYLYEKDRIDETNMAGQFFSPSQINTTKVKAITDNMKLFSNYTCVDSLGELDKSSPVTPITLLGFDNMKARKEMFETWKSLDDREIFIDGRMVMEDGQIYSITKGKEKKYEETLFSDEEIVDAACSLKATTHCGAHVASIMISILNNYLANTYYYKDYIREVPFKYIFSLVPMTVEVYV